MMSSHGGLFLGSSDSIFFGDYSRHMHLRPCLENVFLPCKAYTLDELESDLFQKIAINFLQAVFSCLAARVGPLVEHPENYDWLPHLRSISCSLAHH